MTHPPGYHVTRRAQRPTWRRTAARDSPPTTAHARATAPHHARRPVDGRHTGQPVDVSRRVRPVDAPRGRRTSAPARWPSARSTDPATVTFPADRGGVSAYSTGRPSIRYPGVVSRPAAIFSTDSRRRLRCPRSTRPRYVKWMPMWSAATSWLQPSSCRRARTRSPNAARVAL